MADGIEKLINIGGIQHNGHTIEPHKTLEQLGLSLHYGKCCLRANIPKAEHCRAVRNDSHIAAGPSVVVN